MELVKPWNDGGSLSVTYEGSGDGSAVFSSDSYEGIDREMEVSFVGGGVSQIRTVRQEGIRQPIGLVGGGIFRLANGGRFGVLKVGEPIVPPTPIETYTRLTYIECNGSQYINTDYVVQEDDVIEMTYISTSATSKDKALFGCMDDNGKIWFSIFSNNGYTRFGGNTSSTAVTNARFTYNLVLKKKSVVIGNGNSATPGFDALPQVPLYLFARNVESTSVGMYGYCQCLSFSIKKSSGEVVMNMMPSKRNADGAIGMLDLVSGEFFVNEGTGADFISGAEIRMSGDYETIPYVTFDKDKLFDLGIVRDSHTIDVMFKRNESSSETYLYGCLTSDNSATVSAYLSSGGNWRFGSAYKAFSTNNTHINRIIISNGNSAYNFTTSTFTKSASFTTPNTVILGGCRSASNALYKYYKGLVYFFRITEGNTIIKDWWPCKRKSDGVEGFWDCVTQTFVEPL
jgi:hypothetical protein